MITTNYSLHQNQTARAPSFQRESGSCFFVFILIILATSFANQRATAAEVAVNVYGLSYHLDRHDVEGRRFNEFNYGLGARVSFAQQKRSSYFLEGAMFRDSYRRAARYGVLGYDYRAFGGLSAGFVIGLYDSRAVSRDGSIVAAAPLLSYRMKNVALHLVHLTGLAGINPYPSFALYASIVLWSPGQRASSDL